jgi:hypothetical protein
LLRETKPASVRMTTRIWRVNGGFGFDALGGDGKAVIKDGRAELR